MNAYRMILAAMPERDRTAMRMLHGFFPLQDIASRLNLAYTPAFVQAAIIIINSDV